MSTTTDLSKELPELDHRIGTAGSLSFRNILINGDMRINQRGFDGNWSLLANLAFGYDRWFRSSSTEISQAVEEGNYKPSTTYTLSGTNVTTTQITSPASGNWVITVPNDATDVQLEEGTVATPFELRSMSVEELLCMRYLFVLVGGAYGTLYRTTLDRVFVMIDLPVKMRTSPAIQYSVSSGSSPLVDYTSVKRIQLYFSLDSGGSVSVSSLTADAEITS